MAMRGKFCPGCGERVRRLPTPIHREGWSLTVDAERLVHGHLDGTALCPDMTRKGYQPALPVRSI